MICLLEAAQKKILSNLYHSAHQQLGTVVLIAQQLYQVDVPVKSHTHRVRRLAGC